MACKNPDTPFPGCRRVKTGCAADILEDLFEDLLAELATPAPRRGTAPVAGQTA